MSSSDTYVLAKDVTFPAGSKVFVMPSGSTKSLGVDHASVLKANGKDSVFDMMIDLEEAIQTGVDEKQ